MKTISQLSLLVTGLFAKPKAIEELHRTFQVQMQINQDLHAKLCVLHDRVNRLEAEQAMRDDSLDLTTEESVTDADLFGIEIDLTEEAIL